MIDLSQPPQTRCPPPPPPRAGGSGCTCGYLGMHIIRSSEIPGILCRYYICDKKLAALGWKETTPWEVGLKKTIDWYLHHGFRGYWQGDVESALQPHPSSIPAKVGELLLLPSCKDPAVALGDTHKESTRPPSLPPQPRCVTGWVIVC